MHALFVTAHIEPGRDESEGLKFLEADVLPQLKQFPGVVGGYWLATKDSESLAVVLFENEDAAKQMAEVGLPQAPPAPGATLGAIECGSAGDQLTSTFSSTSDRADGEY